MYIICSKFKELHMEYESDDVWKRRSSRDVWIGKVIGKAYYYVDIFAPLKRYSLCGYESSNGARDLDIGFQFFAVYECLKDCFKRHGITETTDTCCVVSATMPTCHKHMHISLFFFII